MQRTIIICLSLLLASQLCVGQRKAKQDTTYNQKVVLEREFSPVFKDASRIEALPTINEPKREKQPIQYQFSRLDAAIPLQWKIVAPEKKMDRYNYSSQTGFLNIGVGLPTNSLIYGGLELLNDEANQLELSIDHRAISGNRKSSLSDAKQNIYNANTKIGLNYSRPFEFFALNSTISYAHSEFNYFLQNQTIGPMPFLPLNTTIDNSTSNQRNNQLSLKTEVISTADGDISYKGSIAYSYFEKKNGTFTSISGPKEHCITIEGSVKKQNDEKKSVALDFSLINFVYNTNAEDPITEFKAENYGRLTMTPHYNLTETNFEFNAGIRTEFGFKKGVDLKIAPAIDATWEFSPKFFAIANIGGGTTINSFAQSDLNYRYLHPAIRLKDTFAPIDGVLKLKTNIFPRLEVELSTGFKSSSEYYFISQYYVAHLFPISKTNTKRYSIGISAKYDIKDLGDVQLSLQKHQYRLAEFYQNVNDQNIAWGKPDFEMNLTTNLKINEKITAHLDYQLASGRYALYNNETVTMKPINQLDLGGRYRINKRWSAFAQMNNILFQSYDLWYGMPAQNFNFVVGAGFSY
ncbi:MAG: hypothetical protein ACOYOT_05475 [Bacteroidales bacterium]